MQLDWPELLPPTFAGNTLGDGRHLSVCRVEILEAATMFDKSEVMPLICQFRLSATPVRPTYWTATHSPRPPRQARIHVSTLLQ